MKINIASNPIKETWLFDYYKSFQKEREEKKQKSSKIIEQKLEQEYEGINRESKRV